MTPRKVVLMPLQSKRGLGIASEERKQRLRDSIDRRMKHIADQTQKLDINELAGMGR